MPRVVSFGEVLIDFTPEATEPRASPLYRQHAGGAPANVAVAVVRLGGQAHFVGAIAPDPFGDFLLAALEHEGVGTEGVSRPPGTSTALAFVVLDSHGERSFHFRTEGAAHLAFTPTESLTALMDRETVWHGGSNTLCRPQSAEASLGLFERATRRGALVSVDLNWRPLLWPKEADPRRPVWTLLEQAVLVKLTREELTWLEDTVDGSDTALRRLLRGSTRLVIITDGPHPIGYVTAGGEGRIAVPRVRACDTTGAGDAFWGAFLHRLCRDRSPWDTLEDWLSKPRLLEESIRFAAASGALATTRLGSFEAMPRRSELETFLGAHPS